MTPWITKLSGFTVDFYPASVIFIGVMGDYLNVRRIVMEEFKKEFRKLYGRQDFSFPVKLLKQLFDLKSIQSFVDEALMEKEDPVERETLRKYHRNNLRYLAKYFAQTLNNQVRSAGVSLAEAVKDQELMNITQKTLKSNPQCKVYHAK